MKRWMIVTVETELEWPAEEMPVSFMGETLILRPPEGTSAPDVRLQYDHPQFELNAFEAICRFLSALSWWHRRPARGRLRLSCTAPVRGAKGGLIPPLRKEYCLPVGIATPSEPKARLALALYREAVSLQNTPYEFLGYFKIINVCYQKPTDQIAWINKTIPLLAEKRAKERVAVLAAAHTDLGAYLYGSGRCAVAHASTVPVVDPDNPQDVFRLSGDMPVAQALAEFLIENELGLPWGLVR